MLGLGNSASKGAIVSGLQLVTNTKSIAFDGSNDYIALGSATDIAGDWTVSSWMKPSVVN